MSKKLCETLCKTPSPMIAAVERMSKPKKPSMWAVTNRASGKRVKVRDDNGKVLLFASEKRARGWIKRTVFMNFFLWDVVEVEE